MQTWHWFLIANIMASFIFNLGMFYGGYKAYKKLVSNDLKHMQESLDRVEANIKTINVRCEDRGKRLAYLEGKVG